MGTKSALGSRHEYFLFSIDFLDKPEDSSEQQDEEDVNPIKSCGFNPCKIARCLSDPFADCIPNKDCDPVYYDETGNRKKDCSGMARNIKC